MNYLQAQVAKLMEWGFQTAFEGEQKFLQAFRDVSGKAGDLIVVPDTVLYVVFQCRLLGIRNALSSLGELSNLHPVPGEPYVLSGIRVDECGAEVVPHEYRHVLANEGRRGFTAAEGLAYWGHALKRNPDALAAPVACIESRYGRRGFPYLARNGEGEPELRHTWDDRAAIPGWQIPSCLCG